MKIIISSISVLCLFWWSAGAVSAELGQMTDSHGQVISSGTKSSTAATHASATAGTVVKAPKNWVTGTVASVVAGDSKLGGASELAVKDEGGAETKFIVPVGTPCYDKSGMSCKVEDLPKDSKVKVNFRVTDKGTKAKVITALE